MYITTTNIAGYILATSDAIMAIGETPDLCIAEYVREARPMDDEGNPLGAADYDADALLRARSDASNAIYIRPATARLLDAVDLNGGDLAWREIDGVADLYD